MKPTAGGGMKKGDWDNLFHLSTLKKRSPMGEDNYHFLLDLTRKEQEHPENYNGPCFCYECVSSA